VSKLLGDLAPPAVANAKREAADMQKIVDQENGRFPGCGLGLGFLFRKSPKGALRLRRIGAASVLRIEPRHFSTASSLAGENFTDSLQRRHDLPGVSAGRPRVPKFTIATAAGSHCFSAIYMPPVKPRRWMNAYVSAKRFVRDQTWSRIISHSETAAGRADFCSLTE